MVLVAVDIAAVDIVAPVDLVAVELCITNVMKHCANRERTLPD